VSFSSDPEDAKFNGEGYHLPTAHDLSAYFEPDVLEVALEQLHDLAEAAHVAIPELDTFTLKVPDVTVTGQPMMELAEKTAEAMERFLADVPQRKHRVYNERLQAELDVIDDTGMAGYLLLVAAICEFMTEKDIWYGTRGSASGSYACYLLGITQVDPVKHRIRMDRFLSGDRTSAPDIDVDIEHTRRQEVIDWLSARWEVRRVSTEMTYGLEDNEEGKGSLRVKLFSVLRKRGIEEPTWADVTDTDRAMLKDLAGRKLLQGHGVHPAGVIVAADRPTVETLPMSWINSSETLVTSYAKDDIEALGFPKVDLLGLKTLTALRIACELQSPGSGKEFYRAIPDDDKAALKRIGEGLTDGMFQLEGRAQRRGCRELKPRKTADVIAAQALFRPAPMKSGFTESFLRRRRKEEAVPVMHDDIAAETKETYGLAIYQEQLVGVLRRIGMEPLELTRMLKAIKSSGKAGIEKAKVAAEEALPHIRELTASRGWSAEDERWLVGGLADYAGGYSFNLGHAAAYGVIAYRSAYLAEHHTLAFWTGMLIAFTGAKNSRKQDMEKLYVRAARTDQVRVTNPHVNTSGVDYTPDDGPGVIHKGLMSIKGVGRGAAEDIASKAPFTSLRDFAERVTPKRVTCARKLLKGVTPAEAGGTTQALYEAGALKGLEFE
jgi:DNA polymerase-3 subunit alpha